MPAAIMPAQHAGRQTARGEQAKNAFDVRDARSFIVVRICIAAGHFREKCRWRKLFGVANNDYLLGARDRAQCVDRLDLAGFIHDQQVEFENARRQKLRDRQRTHHKHGLQRLHGRARPFHQSADRHMPAFLRDFATQDTKRPDCATVSCRNMLVVHLHYFETG